MELLQTQTTYDKTKLIEYQKGITDILYNYTHNSTTGLTNLTKYGKLSLCQIDSATKISKSNVENTYIKSIVDIAYKAICCHETQPQYCPSLNKITKVKFPKNTKKLPRVSIGFLVFISLVGICVFKNTINPVTVKPSFIQNNILQLTLENKPPIIGAPNHAIDNSIPFKNSTFLSSFLEKRRDAKDIVLGHTTAIPTPLKQLPIINNAILFPIDNNIEDTIVIITPTLNTFLCPNTSPSCPDIFIIHEQKTKYATTCHCMIRLDRCISFLIAYMQFVIATPENASDHHGINNA